MMLFKTGCLVDVATLLANRLPPSLLLVSVRVEEVILDRRMRSDVLTSLLLCEKVLKCASE